MVRMLRMRSMAHNELFGIVGRAAQVFGARLLAQAAGFVAAALVARALGPQGFGIYALATIITLLLAQIPGAGIDMSAVRVSGRYVATDLERARATMLAAGIAKLLCGLLVIVIALLLAEPLANGPLGDPSMALAIRFAAVGALGQAMLEWTLAALQARELFPRMVWVSLLSAICKIAPVITLWSLHNLTLHGALVALVVASYAACALGALLSWRLWFAPRLPQPSIVRELWNFSGWFTLATLIGTLASNLDMLAVSWLLGAHTAGIYGAARNLTLPLAFAGSALIAVILPKMSAMTDLVAMRHTALRLITATGVAVGVLYLPLALIAPLAITLVYGAEYAPATPIFMLLAAAYCVQIATWPAIAYAMVRDRPMLVAALIAVMLLLTAAGYLLFVPLLGMVGAALVFVAGYIVQCAAATLFVLRTRPKGASHE